MCVCLSFPWCGPTVMYDEWGGWMEWEERISTQNVWLTVRLWDAEGLLMAQSLFKPSVSLQSDWWSSELRE